MASALFGAATEGASNEAASAGPDAAPPDAAPPDGARAAEPVAVTPFDSGFPAGFEPTAADALAAGCARPPGTARATDPEGAALDVPAEACALTDGAASPPSGRSGNAALEGDPDTAAFTNVRAAEPSGCAFNALSSDLQPDSTIS